jgi:hypothetical protein
MLANDSHNGQVMCSALILENLLKINLNAMRQMG